MSNRYLPPSNLLIWNFPFLSLLENLTSVESLDRKTEITALTGEKLADESNILPLITAFWQRTTWGEK
jgi:hypothetical protein